MRRLTFSQLFINWRYILREVRHQTSADAMQVQEWSYFCNIVGASSRGWRQFHVALAPVVRGGWRDRRSWLKSRISHTILVWSCHQYRAVASTSVNPASGKLAGSLKITMALRHTNEKCSRTVEKMTFITLGNVWERLFSPNCEQMSWESTWGDPN